MLNAHKETETNSKVLTWKDINIKMNRKMIIGKASVCHWRGEMDAYTQAVYSYDTSYAMFPFSK
jgi:hypothetical protein